MIFERTHLCEVLPFAEEELAWAQEHGLAAVEADALLAGGRYIYARHGDFAKARDYLERSKAICRELALANPALMSFSPGRAARPTRASRPWQRRGRQGLPWRCGRPALPTRS